MGKIYIFAGKSAVGKDRLAKEVSERYGYKFIVSTTTRKIRENEKDGVDYHYTINELFEALIKNGELVEYTSRIVKGKKIYYGITKDSIDLDNYSYVCVTDRKGIENLKKIYGNNAISIYVTVSDDIRLERFKSRETEFDEVDWQTRLNIENSEFIDIENNVDYVVENEDLEKTLKIIDDILK